jgi:hypothetical protein
MKSIQVIFRLLIFLQCLLFATYEIKAAEEIVNVRASGSQVKQGLYLDVRDNKYNFMKSNPSGSNSWKSFFDNHSFLNRVILSIDQTSKVYQSTNYSVNIELSVVYYQWDNTLNDFKATTVSPNPVLTVNYKTNDAYQDKNIYQITGGNRMEVTVVSVTPSVPNVTMNLAIDAEVQVTRYYTFNRTQIPSADHNSMVSSRGELEVYWDFVQGAEEYELEWAHVNNYDANTNLAMNPANIKVDPSTFKFNSTRINTFHNFYRIPLIYERGYIIYRVRGVSRSKADGYLKNIYGNWSDQAGSYNTLAQFPDKFPVTGHEQNLNWQNSVSFAEEGKNKVAVTYFDGSLRSRQVVSKINSEDKTIIGETIYDHEGKGAVQVLPVPTADSKIGFKPAFNQNNQGTAYNKDNFDNTTGNCKPAAESMNTGSGASNYYSPQNPDKSLDINQYIPDAEGYPFTHTEFTPDNTGRIKRQSGVGTNHKLGSNHETKYFYGKPTLQEELDRLFGTEVGPMERYKKNMVVDANGQVSVSYLDPQGRVIATALAGQAPSNLDSLKNDNALSTDETINVIQGDLLNKTLPTDKDGNLQRISGRSKIYESQLLVSTKGTREFNYTLTGEKYLEQCVNGSVTTDMCYNCVLDLEIMLTNECGQQFLVGLSAAPNSTSTVIGQGIIDAIRAGNYTPLCTNPPSFTAPAGWAKTKEPLEVGNYTISKVLTVNREALDFYTDNYLKSNACLLTVDDFIASEISKVDTASCHMTCDQCLTKLGNYSQYDINVNAACDPCLTEEEYSLLYAECQEFCENDPINCEEAYQNMLMDMGPMGQYGELITAEGVFNPELFPLSIFNKNNKLPVKSFNMGGHDWRQPYYKDQAGVIRQGYVDETGLPSFVQITLNEAGEYEPRILEGSTVVTIDGFEYVKPEALHDVRDFFLNWKDSWAKSLVLYHPEYESYNFCISNNASHSFDMSWLNADLLAQAPSGYLNPLGANAAQSIDPYFSSNLAINPLFDQAEYDAMKRSMSAYMGSYSLDKVAYGIVKCPAYNNTGSGGCATNCLNGTITFDDKVWQQYRGMYLSLKQKFMEQKATKYAINHQSYNGCIGDKKFSYFKNGFFTYENPTYTPHGNYSWWPTQFWNYRQPCSIFSFRLYQDKVKRFPMNNDMVESESMDAYTCYDEESEGEFQKVNCPEQNTLVINEMKAKAQFSYFETCGQCPVVKDFESLLNALATQPVKHLNNDFQLSCYPTGEIQEYTPDFEAAIGFSGMIGETFWQIDAANTTSTVLAVKLNRRNGATTSVLKNCNLQLTMQSSYLVKDISTGQMVSKSFAWSDIKGICCLNYDPLDNLHPGKSFEAYAKVEVTYDDQTKADIKIPIKGFTGCLDMNPATCPKPLVCTTTDGAIDVMNMFNMLIYSYAGGMGPDGISHQPKANQFVAQIFLNPAVQPYDESFINSLKQNTGLTGTQLRWKGSVALGTFAGILEGINGSTVTGTRLFEIYTPSNMPAGAGFNDIVSFHSIRADKSSNDPEHNFKLIGLVKYTVGGVQKKTYVEFSGYSPHMNIADCKSPVYNGSN